MKYNIKDVRWLVNAEGKVLPFTINKKGDKIKNVITKEVLKLNDIIEKDIVDQMNASNYKKYSQVFSAKESAVLSKTLGYNVKVLHTEVAISSSFTGYKTVNPWDIYDNAYNETQINEITKRINLVYSRHTRFAKRDMTK